MREKKQRRWKFNVRWTALILSIMLIAVMIGGCGSSESGGSLSSSSGSASASTESSSAEEENASSSSVTFDELTVVDNDECSIILTDYSATNSGCDIKAQMENKSSDKTYMFSVETAAVNGVESDPYFATTVSAGKKSNETINFSDSNLSDNGITDFTDIELTFRVYDDDDWEADDVANETVHVYPYGEENATQYVRESQDSDVVIVDNDYVTAIVTGYDPDGFWGYTVNLYLVNKTDSAVMFAEDDASVNGYMCDPFWAESVGAGHCEFSSLSWYDSDFEENDITDVEEIEMEFSAYNDNDDWDLDYYFDDTVTLNP